jgi:phage baseplate assembly protein W
VTAGDSPFLDFPFHLDGRGRAGTTGEDDHVRDLIHQVLFTSPGERVNRPDFGCGLKTLVFAPASDAIAAATQVLVRAALQRWLENEIAVEGVDVSAEDARVTVTVAYRLRTSAERRVDTFSPPATP